MRRGRAGDPRSRMPSPPDPQTALIVVAPEAEPAVGALRTRFDPSAALGVPAHVTLLHPFMAPASIDVAVRNRLQSIAAASMPFDYRLEAIRRFPETLYLAPEPAAPFVALTHALAAAFPAWLPYGGRHPAVVPHLTVAQTDPSLLDAIESELRAVMGRDRARRALHRDRADRKRDRPMAHDAHVSARRAFCRSTANRHVDGGRVEAGTPPSKGGLGPRHACPAPPDALEGPDKEHRWQANRAASSAR